MKQYAAVVGSKKLSVQLESAIHSFGFDVLCVNDHRTVNKSVRSRRCVATIYDEDVFLSKPRRANLTILRTIKEAKVPFIIVSSRRTLASVYNASNLGAADYIVKPFNQREFVARFLAVVQKKTRITCLGGGTGLFHMLLGLKTMPDVLVTSIVNMSDDGGSSGMLKATFGILPPGDIRRSLVALSNAPEIMNKVMQYRFQRGGEIAGHSFGNLFLTALSEIEGSLPNAVKTISDLLHVQGIVLPITDTNTTLVACFEDGTVIKGESKIDLCEGRNPGLNIQEIWHEPETDSTIDAFAAIMNSEIVIIGPGDLFSSIITNLLVNNIREALARTKARKIYICNLMTKPGETGRYSAFDHVREIVRYMHGDHLDYVVLSNTKLAPGIVRKYARKYQTPVSLIGSDNIHKISKGRVIVADIADAAELFRHDTVKLRNVIGKILRSERTRRGKKDRV